jgi:hypothetical protein
MGDSLIATADAEGRTIRVQTYPDVAAAASRVHNAIASAAARRGRRFHREVMVAGAPRWLDDLAWPFPTWSPTWRPFDWATDEADVPVEPTPPTPYPEQARFRLYLRPPAPAVRG